MTVHSLHHARSCLVTRVYAVQVTYSTLLDGCVKSGQTRAARAVLSQMHRLGLQPNSVTYNSLLRGLAQDEQIDLQVCAGGVQMAVPCQQHGAPEKG